MSLNDGSPALQAGLYGAGAFGDFIAQSLSGSPIARIAAVASRTRSHATNLALRHAVARTHDSFEALLADQALSLIILASPPAEHGRQALAALAAGKHVFVEKPLATRLGEAERLIDEAAERNLTLAVDYPMIYNPLVEAATLFSTARLVGPLLRVSVENIASCRGLDDAHWFWNKDISGGLLVEHGVHFFDWCGRLAGEAKQVLAATASRGGHEDRVCALVKHAGGAMATYYHAFIAQPETERTRTVISFESVDVILDGWIPTRLHVTGPAAAIATTTIRRMLRRTVESIPDARVGFFFDAGKKDALYSEGVRASVEDMVRSIHEPSYIARNDARRAIQSLRVALAASEAAHTGVAVDVDAMKSAALP